MEGRDGRGIALGVGSRDGDGCPGIAEVRV
jgi:hypothetical protein